MKLECDIEADESVSLALKPKEIKRVCKAVLAHEGVARPCMVSVSFVSEEHMRQINAEWRDVDATTDVISLECERPDDPDLGPGEPCELGDIILAPVYVSRQAHTFGTSEADETRLLLVHGMLHLLGYDHLDEDEAMAMEALEEDILADMSTDGTLDHVVITRHRAEEGA